MTDAQDTTSPNPPPSNAGQEASSIPKLNMDGPEVPSNQQVASNLRDIARALNHAARAATRRGLSIDYELTHASSMG